MRQKTQAVAGAVLVVFAIAYDAYDFQVYALGGHAVLDGNELYTFQWRGHGFTYPPFAALVFLPVSALPWLAARVVWQVLSVVCLWWIARTALKLLAGPEVEPSPM